jgi:hypothetical protein
MFDTDLLRMICGKLAVERDPERFSDLVAAIHSVVTSDSEDTRLRMAFLVRHYPDLLAEESKPDRKAA